MMEHGFKLILLWSSLVRGYLVLSDFIPNFDYSTIRDLLKPPYPIVTRSALLDANYLLNLPPYGLTSLTCLVTRWMLIRSLNILVMHFDGLPSSCTIVETHPELVSCSTEGNDMPLAKARNSIPYEDSKTSSHKRKCPCPEKETHFEQQSTAMQNSNPKRQAVNRASRYSSSLSSIIEANNIPNSITGHDVMDSTHMGAQPSLESISTQPLSSFSTIENIKLLFDNLIALPLEDLSDPENETSMKKALSILADNLSLFSEEQAEQILELLFDFPALVHSWREYSRPHMYSQKSSAETEKIGDLVKTSVRDEESLKVRYEEVENKEKELMRELEAVQKEKAEIAEQRTEKSKQTKDLMEKEAHRNKEERLMRIATTKLNDLSHQWAKLQSFFI